MECVRETTTCIVNRHLRVLLAFFSFFLSFFVQGNVNMSVSLVESHYRTSVVINVLITSKVQNI